jgi:hypothetical protein
VVLAVSLELCVSRMIALAAPLAQTAIRSTTLGNGACLWRSGVLNLSSDNSAVVSTCAGDRYLD